MPSTPWGTALNTFVIAHDALVQEIMDKKGLNWGTQYEIARGITQGHWTWDQLKRNGAKLLSDLRGPNVQAAPLVRHVIMSAPASSDGLTESCRKELDREQAALEEGLGRGLGLMGEWEGVEDWYGGKIQQVARVALDNNNKELTIRLEKMEMRKSTAAARFLSSRRMLQIRVPADLMRSRGAQVRQFLQQRFVLCGRMFVPFHAKDRSVYLMEINEDYERKHERPSSFADDSRISLEDFINWANPLHVNDKQPIRKWSTRLTLYLSTSVPALEFDAENILFIDDEYAPHQGKPQAEEIMTDGCGFINLSGLEAIKQFFRYNLRPTAVQGRIAGSKGLWTLHPDDRDTKNPPRIWIRSSQRKIQFSPAVKNYRSHKIFNFLAPDRVTEPARSSRQSIINMAHNCVPHGAFIDLMRLTMAEEAKKFMEMRPSVAAQTVLLDAVDKAGHVVGARLQRQSKGLARAYGLAGRDFGNDDLGPDDEEDSAEDGVTDIPGRSDYNKAPRSIYEAAYEMLQSGFNHQYSPLLYTKLQLILKYILDSYVNEYHITLPESAEAFCIPDPYGVLEEGELYFRTTSGEIYTGDVLVYRNPARLPSDVRKMKAVNHPALGEYPNVIVFSTKGSRSAASWLGGGDTVVITKFLPLVEPFVNPLFFPAPPDFLEKNFEKDVELVPAFLARIRNMSPQVAQEAFQGILLLSLADTKVGLYSTFHDYAVYIFGYDHPFTIRLAYMFTTELDSSKTGLRIKRDVFDKDQKAFGQPRPECLDPSTKQPPKRNTIKLGDFVLDALLEVGKKERADHLTQYEHLPTQHKVPDNDLRLPYETAVQAARSEAIRVYGRIPYKENGVVKYYPAADIYGGLEHELQRIISHVKQVFNSHWPPAKIGSTSSKNRYNDQTKKKADLYDQVACAFHNGPQPFEDEDGFLGFLTPNVEEVKASYAYIRPEHKDTFGFAVAFKELCGIKARAASHSTIRQPIAEAMALKSSHVRLLQKEEDN
ncbi:hypothetical protein PLICRDRAFT_675257 [Plicaturopsis crispa FD-325 SS-3]|nr:hypothetical protein PLICRDRAFT_675257 [Plicaturopsis crispa FD-325 SS-3]